MQSALIPAFDISLLASNPLHPNAQKHHKTKRKNRRQNIIAGQPHMQPIPPVPPNPSLCSRDPIQTKHEGEHHGETDADQRKPILVPLTMFLRSVWVVDGAAEAKCADEDPEGVF